MGIDYTRLLEKLNPDPGAEDTLRLRVATVTTINANGTVDITMSSGVIVPGVPRLSSASVSVGNVVQVISQRGSLLIIGTVAGGGSGGGMTSNRLATTIRTSSSSSITAETLMDTVAAELVSGKVYRITYDAGFTSATALDTVFLRLRENNLVGTQLSINRYDNRVTNGGGSRWPARIEVEFTAVATGSKTFAATLQCNVGTSTAQIVAGASLPVYLYVDYIRG